MGDTTLTGRKRSRRHSSRIPAQIDAIAEIAEIAVAITKPGRRSEAFRESKLPPGEPRKQAWKELQNLRRQEHRAWLKEKQDMAGKGFWRSKKAADSDGHNNAWEVNLQQSDTWRDDLVTHFENIFHKKPVLLVTQQIDVILTRPSRLCKLQPWIPFDHEELREVRKRWKNNKSCGPDSISHEALKVLGGTDIWTSKLLYIMNDLLYVAKIPETIESGITVLLAKKTIPTDWGDTRPMTLSSVLLKTFSQLIIHRVAHRVQVPARLQWSRRHRQGVELILILRKVCRTAHDWGIPMFLAKLDIRKAFDSVSRNPWRKRLLETWE